MPGLEKSYDHLAPHFRSYSEARAAYLGSIDRLILRRIPAEATSLLDVGSGDGLRAARLAARCSVSRLILSDPSEEMVSRCRFLEGVAEVWRVAAEELPDLGERFGVITCLWNVFGLVSDTALRVEALRRMRSLLAPRGRIFLDVNNRYNAPAYGRLKTAGRVLYDLLRPSDANGDVSFSWRVGGELIETRGHVFRPGEMKNLIEGAGLKVALRHVVDYETGQLRKSAFAGQLFYELAQR
ncbi:MAG TPA: class I SAM-dependent methyltransferase [Pyrinomonadaceae bacterium]|jgi:SAM-dependent methyltransferase